MANYHPYTVKRLEIRQSAAKEKDFMIRKTLEEFKNDMYKKFKNEYIVTDTVYKNNKTPIKVLHTICKKEFLVRPDLILNNYKQGCPYCNKLKLKTTKQFLEEVKKIYGDEYTVLSEYINADTKIKVKHNICRKYKRSFTS